MYISPRLLRAHADNLPGNRPVWNTRELARQDRILNTAQSLMALHGRVHVTMLNLSIALRMAPVTLRRHFCDPDELLGEILLRHLRTISAAIGAIPLETPNREAACRAAYIDITRHYGGSTQPHALLLNDRHNLPPDLADTIEKIRLVIGQNLCLADPAAALKLLDSTEFQLPQIEAMLTTLQQQAASPPPAAEPEPPRASILARMTPETFRKRVEELGRFAPPSIRAGPEHVQLE